MEPTKYQKVHTMFPWQLVILDTEGFGDGLAASLWVSTAGLVGMTMVT